MTLEEMAYDETLIREIVKKRDEDRAVGVCIARGYENLKREDREGKTRSGWWCDEVWIGRTAVDALRSAVLGSY